jgi:hypothetical protein
VNDVEEVAIENAELEQPTIESEEPVVEIMTPQPEVVAEPLDNVESQPDCGLPEVVAEPKIEETVSQPEFSDLKHQEVAPKPKKRRRARFDVVMLVAIVVTIAALAVLALGIYNTCISDKADNSADDAIIEEIRMQNRVE